MGTHVPANAPAPRLRVFLVMEFEEEPPQRVQIFQTEELPAGKWGPDGILKKGYYDYQMMFNGSLNMTTDEDLHIELQFENRSGYCHVPSDFGLRLHYVPELETPQSSSDEEEDQGKRKKGRGGASVKDKMQVTAVKTDKS